MGKGTFAVKNDDVITSFDAVAFVVCIVAGRPLLAPSKPGKNYILSLRIFFYFYFPFAFIALEMDIITHANL